MERNPRTVRGMIPVSIITWEGKPLKGWIPQSFVQNALVDGRILDQNFRTLPEKEDLRLRDILARTA